MDKQQLQDIFQRSFDHAAWQQVLTDVFGVTEIRHEPRQLENESNDRVEGYEVGWLDTTDGHHIGIYEFEIKKGHNIQMNRVGLRGFVKSLVKYRDDAALVVFHDKEQWRLSFVCDLREEKTAPKRFTYALGIATETYRTPAERLAGLGEPTFENIRHAFSVEALSKDFFKDYKDQYAKFCNYISGDEKWERDYVKKMLGRLVFLQFLQKKGWMGVPAVNKDWSGGDGQYLQNLVSRHKGNDRLLSDVLEPLFFETLNKQRNGDLADSILGRDIKIPYLNGGLFDKDDLDRKEIDFPYYYFAGLADFFSQYNFTIDENDPYDSEVGIDPEMLGHIFENLLEDNKDKGAFYTPKEIVQYMCRQSLVGYLQSKLGVHPEIEHFINTGETGNRLDSKNFIARHAKAIGELLDNVKICDPAIGSGAFPMGLLNEIFHAKMALNMTLDRATVKKNIIQNSIYGVDIEQGAVDIARLRFWLSLVVDEIEPQPLPNLDYKIMQGNSLLESFAGLPLDKIGEIHKQNAFAPNLFTLDTEINFSEDIDSLMEAYFNTTDHEVKTDLRNRIDNQVKERIIDSLERQLEDKRVSIEGMKRQLTANSRPKSYKNIEMLEKEHTELCERVAQIRHLHGENNLYFLWHTYFKEVFDEGGFDIVIGNPPYIQLQKMGKEADALAMMSYQTYARTGDIYCLFYELGIDILKPDGWLSFITSNKWMRAGYGEAMRRYFVEQTNPVCLIDFAGYKVFDSATVDVNIMLAQKAPYAGQTLSCVIDKAEFRIEKMSEYTGQNLLPNKFTSESWVVLNPIEQSIKSKIERIGKPLKDWNVSINYGIKTGFNEAFIIDGQTKDELINKSPKSADIIRPILRGRDIKRYKADFADLWLLNIHNGTDSAPPVDIYDYPEIKVHLDQFYPALEARQDKGITPYNLRSCAYTDDFSKQKIVWAELARTGNAFTLDDSGAIVLNTCYILTLNSDNPDRLKQLLAFLNSRLILFYMDLISSKLDETGWRWLKQFVERLPILDTEMPDKNLILLTQYADKQQNEINYAVCKMYGLTKEEIDYIENL